MSDSNPILILEIPCSNAISWVVGQIKQADLRVVLTFELPAASNKRTDFLNSEQVKDPCDCQIVVMLVYGESEQPASLVAHSHNGRTWFTLVDTPQQRADPRLENVIRQALQLEANR